MSAENRADDPESFCPRCKRTHAAPEFFEYLRAANSTVKLERVAKAAAMPRDDLAKYLIRLDTAVQALHK